MTDIGYLAISAGQYPIVSFVDVVAMESRRENAKPLTDVYEFLKQSLSSHSRCSSVTTTSVTDRCLRITFLPGTPPETMAKTTKDLLFEHARHKYWNVTPRFPLTGQFENHGYFQTWKYDIHFEVDGVLVELVEGLTETFIVVPRSPPARAT